MIWALAAIALGVGLVAASFFLVKRLTTLSTVTGLFAAVGGLALLILGVSWLAVPLQMHVFMRKELSAELARTTEVIVEIQAARITAAESIDDDANAIILHDGHGQGVYINSHRLFEIDDEGSRYPTSWRLTLTAREGKLGKCETSGPLMEVQYESDDIEPPDDVEWAEVVVLDELTSERFRWLMPRAGPSRLVE